MVALLEHVQVHSLLVLEPHFLRLFVSVERIHEHQRNVAVVLVVQELCVCVCVCVCACVCVCMRVNIIMS